MKNAADLLFEQVIQMVEPLTRFDRSSLTRELERTTEAAGEASCWYRPRFSVTRQNGAGPLPGSVRRYGSSGEAAAVLNAARQEAIVDLPRRLAEWVAREKGTNRALSPRDCWDGAPEAGSQMQCGHCGGAGRTTCGGCGGRGRNQCSGCSGRGDTQCGGCGGSGSQRCGTCGGMGRQQKYVTKTVWDGYNNRYHSQSQLETENCAQCLGTGNRTCSQCSGRRQIRCHSCAGTGQVPCGPCGTSGKVGCSSCGATGSVHERIRIDAAVDTGWDVRVRHESSEAVGLLQARTLEQLAEIGIVQQLEPHLEGETVRRYYRFTCLVTQMVVETGEKSVSLVGIGPGGHVSDFKNIVGLLLEADLRNLEQAIAESPQWALRPSLDLHRAVHQCLASEANVQLGQAGGEAQRLLHSGSLSTDYASRLTGAMRSALGRMLFAEVAIFSAAAAAIPALGVLWIIFCDPYSAGPRPLLLLLLMSAAVYAGGEWLGRSRLEREYGPQLGPGRLGSILAGQRVAFHLRFATGVVAFLGMLAAMAVYR